MTEPLIEARGLVKEYPGVVALAGADLDLLPGEILGLVGKNGAGKSTLIKILAGAERPDRGEVKVAGEPLPELYSPRAAHRLGLAFVHQELATAPDLSVAENVAVGSHYPRRLGVFVSWRGLDDAVSSVLADLDPRIDVRARVGDLSSVQQRIVMIARAMYHRARVLVLDEPSAALADEEVSHLHEIVRQLRAGGRSVIYVTHRLREVISVTDRVVVMRDGVVTLVRPTAGLDESQLVDAIAGEDGGRETATATHPVRRSAPAKDTLLSVRGLTRPGVVEDVSFDLREGEILGIGGLVGSGRTELVRMIFGADRAVRGTVEVRGKPAKIRSPRDGVRAGIALLPEDRRHQGLVLGFSVRENVTLASLARHRRQRRIPFPSPSREQRATIGMIERLGIACRGPEQEARLLSGGTQQKVVLAKWLEQNNQVLIFDEPTQGIDVHAKEEIFRLVRRAASEGRGIIVISSDFAELVSLCERVLVMHEGRVAGVLEGNEVTEAAIVQLAYQGESAAVL